MKIAFLAALLLGIGSAAGAQEAPPAREASAPLTLRKCLEIGLEQNYDVRIASSVKPALRRLVFGFLISIS